MTAPSYPRKCYVLMTDTLCEGPCPIGFVTGENSTEWLTFDTEREAQLEIIDDVEEYIVQFKAGERDFDAVFDHGLYVSEAVLADQETLVIEDKEFKINNYL